MPVMRSIEECRAVMGADADGLSDEQIADMRDAACEYSGIVVRAMADYLASQRGAASPTPLADAIAHASIPAPRRAR